MTAPGGPWTERAIAVLRARWEAGDSARTIGAVLRMSRNAVIGKAHRLGLPARPSPIVPVVGEVSRKTLQCRVRRERARERALAAEVAAAELTPQTATVRVTREQQTMRAVQARAVPPVPPSPPALPLSVWRTCQWIEGHGRPWAMCGAPAVVGLSWCPEHAGRAYVVRPRAAVCVVVG